ncbi:MAG: PilZ domain-containing protein [Desulfobacterales bacterium]|jgi:Tfp pilus assembly protein PilZ|nr:PilZ domain-containing protein [Desulfobacterales bacterium]
MSASAKDQKIMQYNVTISELIKLILSLNEEHQEALLKKGRELLSKEGRAPRKTCQIPVKYTTFDRVYSDQILNISQSGVFIETRRPIFVGEEILMDFKIEGVDKALRMEGKVVHASSRGVGIEFKKVDPALSQILPAIFDLIEG